MAVYSVISITDEQITKKHHKKEGFRLDGLFGRWICTSASIDPGISRDNEWINGETILNGRNPYKLVALKPALEHNIMLGDDVKFLTFSY